MENVPVQITVPDGDREVRVSVSRNTFETRYYNRKLS